MVDSQATFHIEAQLLQWPTTLPGLVFCFKMTDIMMKIQQAKMALIFLIVDVFGNIKLEIDAVLLVNLTVYLFFHSDV